MIDILRRVPLFRSFPETSLEALASLLETQEYREGQVIFGDGDSGDSAFIVAAGKVEISKRGKTLLRLDPGQFFGEKHFDQDVRTSDATALCDCTLARIRHEDFKAFLLEHPENSLDVLWGIVGEVSRRLFQAREYLVTLAETGRIVGGQAPVSELTERILQKLLDAMPEGTGGAMVIDNPFTGALEVTASQGLELDEPDQVTTWTAGAAPGGRSVICVPLRDADRILGYIALDRTGEDPFGVDEEIIVSAVGEQVGLGILNAYHRQEEEARRKLEQGRMRRY